MSKENLNTLLSQLEQMEAPEILVPNIPIDVFVQEAYDLIEWTKGDVPKLKKAGLSTQMINDLPIAAGALRYAQSVWMKERYSQEEAEREWKEVAPAVYELKNSLEDSMRFAFRRRTDLLSKVQVIEEGTGHADMVQDLSDLSVLGKSNLNLLRGIGMDVSQLDVAEEKSTEMASLLGRVNGDKYDDSNSKETRDREYTFLKRIMDEIRMTGKYVFRKDPKRLIGYSSRYYRSN